MVGFVVHTKTKIGKENFAVTTASGPLREALTDFEDPLAQHYGLPPHSVILLKSEFSGNWVKI